MPTSRFTQRQSQLGTALFTIGSGSIVLAMWENASGLPFAMPALWYNQRMFCLAVALSLAAFGFFVMLNGPQPDERRRGVAWRPTRPGRRFRSLVVYSRANCHLCDEAVELLQSYLAWLPMPREIDIDTNPELRQRFDVEIPVIEIDGKVRFKGRVSELLLRRLIEGTPPK